MRLTLTLVFFLSIFGCRNVDNGVHRIACVGDSITYGQGILRRHSYPSELGRMLGPHYEVRNFGVNGTTVLTNGNKPYRNTKAYRDSLVYKPDTVILGLGTNDIKPRNWKHHDSFVFDLQGLVGEYLSLPDKPNVFLVLPVPIHRELRGIPRSRLRTDVIPRIQMVAKKLSIPTIDLHGPMQLHPDLFPDGVHPDHRGAKLMAQLVYETIRRNLLANMECKNVLP